MNKYLLFDWLLQDLERNLDTYYNSEAIKEFKLEDASYEINNRREIALPPTLPKTPEKMIPILREHFKENVTFISLVLNYYFPEQYFFYRVSKFESEIFQGFEFFSEIIPAFEFPFVSVGTKGFNRYLKLNEKLMNFAHQLWPEEKTPQLKLSYFLYQGLGDLFLEKNNYHHYWVMATYEEYFWALDSGEDVNWSGRKEMQTGDLAFMYRTAPRSAITDIYEVKSDPLFNPWSGWGGFDVDMKKVCTIKDISFSEMKNDRVLRQWGIVKRNFVGTVTEPIPHSAYNQLLTKIPPNIQRKHNLKPEPVATIGRSGQFALEAEFDEEVISPLLRRWGFKYKYQFACLFRIGSQYHRGWVDFYVSDQNGPLTLFEDKLRILNDRDLKFAVDQAKSYALLLGLPSFVVASPEGMWLYALNKNEESLVKKVSSDEMSNQTQEEEVRNLLLKLRQKRVGLT